MSDYIEKNVTTICIEKADDFSGQTMYAHTLYVVQLRGIIEMMGIMQQAADGNKNKDHRI